MSFICHIHNYTEYNEEWNVFSAFNPSKCTHTWNSGQPTLQRPGSSWGFSALLKGLTSVMDNSCRSRDSNPQPRITSLTLYPLGHDCQSQVVDKKTASWDLIYILHECTAHMRIKLDIIYNPNSGNVGTFFLIWKKKRKLKDFTIKWANILFTKEQIT